jgi:hypothetical protein
MTSGLRDKATAYIECQYELLWSMSLGSTPRTDTNHCTDVYIKLYALYELYEAIELCVCMVYIELYAYIIMYIFVH